MHICVLGAGVVGVTTAYCLLQRGHEVTLVDECSDAGYGASFGNGAQLSYSHVAPLADPSVWRKWPHYLFSSSSPLTLRPMADGNQWQWLASFLAACTAKRARETTVQLLRLASYSQTELMKLQAREDLDFHHRIAGKLVLCSTADMFEAARQQVEFQALHGSRQTLLSIDECVGVEPALAHGASNWVGGVYAPDDEVGDCAAFCRGLSAVMKRSPRFRLVSGKARPGAVSLHRLREVQVGGEKIEADIFVLALGSQSREFARETGFALPVYPLKGYSITVPVRDNVRAPKVSITDLSRKIVYARVGDQLRVAGRVELVGMDRGIPQRAIDELKRGTAALFPAGVRLDNDAMLMPWCGFRPATPTGLPLVGASPLVNMYLNTGHGSLGWTLASGSASLLADQIEGNDPAFDPAPFHLPMMQRTGVQA